MNDWAIGFVTVLFRTTLIMSASAALMLLALRLFRVTSPRLRRLACVAVLLQGWLLVPLPVTLPVSLSSHLMWMPIANHPPESPPDSYYLELVETKTGSVRGFDFEMKPNSPPADKPVPQDPAMKARTPDAGSITGPVLLKEPESAPIPWAVLLVGLWFAGIVVILARSVRNYLAFIRRLPASSSISPACLAEWTELQRQAGVRVPVPLHAVPQMGPLLCWHPRGFRLIVPAELWETLTAEQRRPILQHELAHLLRRDILKSLAVRFLALPYWFNPLVGRLVKQFDDCAEWACDEAVRAAETDAVTGYARTLLQLAETTTTPLLATTAASGGHGLAIRIRRLMVPQPHKDSIMKKLVMMTLVLSLTAFQVVRFQVQADDQPKSAPDASKIIKKETKTAVHASGQSTLKLRGGSSGVELTSERAVVYFDDSESEKDALEAVEGEVVTSETQDDAIPAQGNKTRIQSENITIISGGAELVIESQAKRTEAMVDIGYLFKHAKPFEQERENLRAVVGENEHRMKRMLEEFKSLKEKYKSAANPSQSDSEVMRAQRLIVKEKAKQIEAEASAARSMILGKETEMNLAMYEKVVAEVTAYAKEQGIRVVRRGERPQQNLVANLMTKDVANLGVGGSRKDGKGGNINFTPSIQDGKSEAATMLSSNTASIDGRKSEKSEESNSSQLLKRLMEKEVIYSESDQENDITEEILNRLNARFDTEKASEPATERR